MRIKRFRAKNVHDYMNFDIKFNNDISFLTGINGSGKTTIIQCLYAIMFPSFRILSRIQYDFLEVDIQLATQRRHVKITSNKYENKISLTTSETAQELIVPIFLYDSASTSQSMAERELEYYHDVVKRNPDNDVLNYIQNLPSPMFLGIDRRSLEPLTRRPIPYHYARRDIREISTRSLQYYSQYYSILEAEGLARDSYALNQTQQMKLKDTLRENILLNALEFVDINDVNPTQFTEMLKDVQEVSIMIRDASSELDLPIQKVEHETALLIDKLRNISTTLGSDIDNAEALGIILEGDDEEKKRAYIELVVNSPHFLKINTIFKHARDYIQKRQRFDQPIKQYLDIVNGFLHDSKKEIFFDDMGFLQVKIPGKTIPITSLSSGESQIFVMLTHLAFNPDAKQANVFMVDEPELSLHVAWQELFVDSIIGTNPNIQIILATHAPSIILERTDKCIDLGR